MTNTKKIVILLSVPLLSQNLASTSFQHIVYDIWRELERERRSLSQGERQTG
jgi:hypothetical protein